jgi:hypothetical protein
MALKLLSLKNPLLFEVAAMLLTFAAQLMMSSAAWDYFHSYAQHMSIPKEYLSSTLMDSQSALYAPKLFPAE